jgi:phosphate starvation-inducible membrane PsiE
MAVYIFITAVLGVFLSARTYKIRQAVSVFILSSTALLLILATIVANSLISLQ